MKPPLIALLTCTTLLAATSFAAEKKPTKVTEKKHSTLPAKSPMISLPDVPEIAGEVGDHHGLISTDLDGRDIEFFSVTYENGVLQAYLCDLVKAKAEADQVRAVAKALAVTQAEENKQIARLASLKGLSVPTEAPAAQAGVVEELEKLSGARFDKTSMEKIIVAGQKSLAAYEKASESKDGDIKAFAEQMTMISKEKLRLAEKMTGGGRKGESSGFFRTTAPKAD